MNSPKTFEFVSYKHNVENKELHFTYRLNNGEKDIFFEEKLILPEEVKPQIPLNLLDSIMHALHLMLGISYWKLYCPEDIIISTTPLTKEQAAFWNMVYTKGLGEFFYKNQIDFRDLVQFPYREDISRKQSIIFPRNNRSLVGIGGGKDSIVTAELLKENSKEYTSLIIDTQQNHVIPTRVAELIGNPQLKIVRQVDAQLFELNTSPGTFNGHVPVSAMYAFIGILIGILYDYSYVIVSNEKSASYGNVEYLGEVMNHQWSKSLEFEKMFQSYVKTYITPNVVYFSLLRPLSEFKITELFSKYSIYFPQFSSCNRNYALQKENAGSYWCCNCPKCAFVFVLMAAFIQKDALIRILGENLLAKESLIPVYKELLGVSGFKPFECVGTPEEIQLAFYKVHEKGEYRQDVVMKMFENEVLPKIQDIAQIESEVNKLGDHLIPEEFVNLINKFKSSLT